MRSKLLASVAVASFAVVALPHAASAAATMKVGGSIETNMSWTQQTDAVKPINTASSGGLINRLRLQFDPSMVVDGLTVGARLRTEAANGTYGYSKAFGYVSGPFGKVTFGRNGALGYAGTWTNVGNNGQGMIGPDEASVLTKAFTGPINWRIEGAMGSYTDAVGVGAGNANTINYETPAIMGLQAGVTYAPKWGTNSDWNNSRGDATAFTNAAELAVKYGTSFAGIDINVSAGILTAQAPAGTGNINDPAARAGITDAAALKTYDETHANFNGESLKKSIRSYGANLNVSAFDAIMSVGYTNAGKSSLANNATPDQTNLSTTAVTVALGYNVAKNIAVGGYYASGYATADDLVSTDKLREYGFGAEYTVVPGFSVYVSADHIDSTNNAAAGSTKSKASVGSIGSTINF